MAIKHNKVSTIADDIDAVNAGEVVPSDWNDAHVVDASGIVFSDATTQTTAYNIGGTNGQLQYNNSGVLGGLTQTEITVAGGTAYPTYYRLISGAYIAGDQSGDARGTGALDIQGARAHTYQVASGQNAVCIGSSNQANNFYSLSLGVLNVASGSQALSIGGYNNSSANSCLGLGLSNQVSGNLAVTVGYSNAVFAANSLGVGSNNNIDATSTASSAIGYAGIIDHATDSFAGGTNCYVLAPSPPTTISYGISIGGFNTCNGNFSIVTGFNSYADHDFSGVFGYSISTCPANTVRYGVGATNALGGTGTYNCYLDAESVSGYWSLNALGLRPQTNNSVDLGSAGLAYKDLYMANGTNTTAGAAATINFATGRFRVSAGTTTFTLTNSHIAATNTVICQPCQNDATGRVNATVPAAGSATIYLTAPTANMDVMFMVIKV